MPTPLKTIDITPTWSGLLPTLIHLATSATTAKARQTAMSELRRMAHIADMYVEASNLTPRSCTCDPCLDKKPNSTRVNGWLTCSRCNGRIG